MPFLTVRKHCTISSTHQQGWKAIGNKDFNGWLGVGEQNEEERLEEDRRTATSEAWVGGVGPKVAGPITLGPSFSKRVLGTSGAPSTLRALMRKKCEVCIGIRRSAFRICRDADAIGPLSELQIDRYNVVRAFIGCQRVWYLYEVVIGSVGVAVVCVDLYHPYSRLVVSIAVFSSAV